MKRSIWVMAAVSLLFFINGCESETESTQDPVEEKSKIVIDDAYVLLDNVKMMKMYKAYNEGLLQEFDIDFRVITTSSQEDIDLFANKAFTTLQKESRSKSGKALLLVVNTMQDKVRLEVSMALEPVYTDAFISYVERKGMVPYLRDYKIADGIYMMTELVHDRAVEATAGMAFMPPMESKSIGAGAKSKAHIGVADTNAKKGAEVLAHSTDDPKAVLQKYIEALKKHNKNPKLDIYTDTTKDFFAKWTVTDINQDHEVENIAKCLNLHEVLYSGDVSHAVLAVTPYDKHRTCSPYFFKKEQGKWKLDIASMAQMLRFNSSMQMHFDKEKRLEDEGMYYAFAFDGYGFDKNGYPFTPKNRDPEWEKYRWGYSCGSWYHPEDKNRVKTEPENVIRCYISNYGYGMPSNVRLGLDVQDYIQAVGVSADRIDNVTKKQFMRYMNSIPSGGIATVEVKRKGKRIVRKGIAP